MNLRLAAVQHAQCHEYREDDDRKKRYCHERPGRQAEENDFRRRDGRGADRKPDAGDENDCCEGGAEPADLHVQPMPADRDERRLGKKQSQPGGHRDAVRDDKRTDGRRDLPSGERLSVQVEPVEADEREQQHQRCGADIEQAGGCAGGSSLRWRAWELNGLDLAHGGRCRGMGQGVRLSWRTRPA